MSPPASAIAAKTGWLKRAAHHPEKSTVKPSEALGAAFARQGEASRLLKYFKYILSILKKYLTRILKPGSLSQSKGVHRP
jgi:hypothetical protein